MKKIITLTVVLSLAFSISSGQSLDDYLKAAAENNLELKAYFNDYLAAMEEVPQVGALPDPELSIGFFLQPMERLMGTQQADIQLMQMFPWFGMLQTQKDEASKMALAKSELFRDAKHRLFYEVKTTWFELYRLEEEIRITKENLEILKTYERLALIRFQGGSSGAGSGAMYDKSSMQEDINRSSASGMSGMGANMNKGGTAGKSTTTNNNAMTTTSSMNRTRSGMSDVLRVRMEVKDLENTLALLMDSRKPLQVTFNKLLSRDLNEPIVIADSLPELELSHDRLALLDSITQNNPMLKMLKAEEEAYDAQQKMARLEGRPMVGLGVNYMPFSPRNENGMSMGGNDMVMPMIRMTIPIYRKKYDAMKKEASLKQLAVQQRHENTTDALAVEWSTALRNLDDAARRIILYREQSDLAGQTLNLLMTSYSTEGRYFEEVLRTQQQLLNYQLRLVSAIADQHTVVAALENLAATELK